MLIELFKLFALMVAKFYYILPESKILKKILLTNEGLCSCYITYFDYCQNITWTESIKTTQMN